MEITIYEIALIPLISGLVEMFKPFGLKKKYSSLLATGIGLLLGMFYIEPTDIKKGILIGLMLGLSSSGLYSGTKSVKETINKSRTK